MGRIREGKNSKDMWHKKFQIKKISAWKEEETLQHGKEREREKV